jgi:hypothetical protein
MGQFERNLGCTLVLVGVLILSTLLIVRWLTTLQS